MSKPRLASIWLDGCSGCHMSMLDMDERLLEIAALVDVVYGPWVDAKALPSDVDVWLVEGSISTEEDLHKIRAIRRNTRTLVSLGDCAVTGNVPAMRNRFGVDAVAERVYRESAQPPSTMPRHASLPVLLERVRPVHEVVPVELAVPGCPPSADAIHFVLTELVAGRIPDVSSLTRFGA